MAYTSITVISILIINIYLVLSCPSKCSCSSQTTVVDCRDRQLTSIPQNIPENTTELRLEKNAISFIANGSFDGLSSLRYFYLQYNVISNIQAGIFRDLRSLLTLRLFSNNISYIANGSFDGLSLIYLSLGNNMLSNIQPGLFRGLPILETLFLYNNDISYIANGSFDGISSSLKQLALDNNVISNIQGIFRGLRSLTYLNLTENNISYIANGTFDGLSSLRTLYLYNNVISNIPSYIFRGLRSLETLSLNNNVISYIANGSLDYIDGLPNLQRLRLDGNNLTTLPEGAFPPPTRDIDIRLTDNPWHCDCNIRWLQYLLLNVTFITTDSSIMCKTPSVHASKVLINIQPPNLMCPAMETTTPYSVLPSMATTTPNRVLPPLGTTTPNSVLPPMDTTTPNSVLPPMATTTPNRMLPPMDTTTPNLILPISIGAGCLFLVTIVVLVFIVIKQQRKLKKRDDNAEGIQGYDDVITSLPRAEPEVTNNQQETVHHHYIGLYDTIDEDGVTHVVHAQPEHIAIGQTNSNNPPGSNNVMYETRITTSI